MHVLLPRPEQVRRSGRPAPFLGFLLFLVGSADLAGLPQLLLGSGRLLPGIACLPRQRVVRLFRLLLAQMVCGRLGCLSGVSEVLLPLAALRGELIPYPRPRR
ncbi:hypothetical protein ACWDAO_09805 [Streptomyces sp. NPDC001212]